VKSGFELREFETVVKHIAEAKCPEDVFGSSKIIEPAKIVQTVYRRLAGIVHPDHFVGSPAEKTAQEATATLNRLKTEAEHKISLGTYGDYAPATPLPPPTMPTVVRAKGVGYELGKTWRGDVCDLYDATYNDAGGVERRAVFKIAQHSADNDLVANEAKVLAALYPKDAKDEKFYRYLCRPRDAFLVKTKASNRQAVVMERATDYVTIEQVWKAYDFIDYRDAAWMFRRTLSAIGFAHRQGYVHGAVIPPHVMVHPITHGAKLVDWCYAVPVDDLKARVKAIATKWRKWYAPEVLTKDRVTPQTDIYMAAEWMRHLVNSSTPTSVRNFLKSCTLTNPSRRPNDAWALHEEFGELLRALVGPPRYRPFAMPS
jgi:serine/threonine protein kinase